MIIAENTGLSSSYFPVTAPARKGGGVMVVYRKEEMQRLEEAAGRAGVSLSRLMQGAGEALAREIACRVRPLAGCRVVLLCGKGNNGGDGFVCAGKLTALGARCAIVLVQGEPAAQLAREAFLTLPPGLLTVDALQDPDAARQVVDRAQVLVDCVFGFGFRGSLSGSAAQALAWANAREGCLKIAADLPSGAECDSARVSPGTFRAAVTVAFTGLKPAHVSYPAKEYCGETVVRPVGIPAALLESADPAFFRTGPQDVRPWLAPAPAQANKGDLGKLLLAAGSWGMAGACILAARAALRCGVGLVTLAVDHRIYPMVTQAVPEAVCLPLDWTSRRQESRERLCAALERATACVLGPGLGELAEAVCPTVLAHCAVPLLVDADGLNFAARHPEALEEAEAPLVLTPHPGEMARLCGDSIPEVQADRLGAAREKARETGAVVLLKGASTVICSPRGRTAANPTGNPGMAKGGSGDALSGIIGALLAQGVPAFEAAVTGAYLHGLAGDLAAARLGQRSLLPSDLIDELPRALQKVPEMVE